MSVVGGKKSPRTKPCNTNMVNLGEWGDGQKTEKEAPVMCEETEGGPMEATCRK